MWRNDFFIKMSFIDIPLHFHVTLCNSMPHAAVAGGISAREEFHQTRSMQPRNINWPLQQ